MEVVSTAVYVHVEVSEDTEAQGNADTLSRLPLPAIAAQTETSPDLVLLTDHLSESSVTTDHSQFWTRRDPYLVSVLQFLRQGWPMNCEGEQCAY